MPKNKSYIDQIQRSKTKIKVELSLDERMRILANLMIDRILEDYKGGHLKFVSKSDKVIMEH